MTPRQVRIGLRERRLRLVTCFPAPPPELSKFQQTRLRKAFYVVYLYLNKGVNVEAIAAQRQVEHQRISQILKLGIDYLIEAGKIRAVEKLAA